MPITGVNIRQSFAYTLDPSGFDACTSSPDTRTYTAGQGFGYVGTAAVTRNRSQVSPNLAGMGFTSSNGIVFRYDLPSGAGAYDVGAAFYDALTNMTSGYTVRDGTAGTVIAYVSGIAGTTQYRDINSVSRIPANFNLATESVINHTFVNDFLTVTRDTSIASGNGAFSSVWVNPAGGFVGLGGEQGWWCPTLDDSPDDISGNGNNGTYIGGMGTVANTGSGGTRAYDFDGTNDYIDISGFAANTSAYSVSCWIDGTGPSQTIVAFNSGDSSGGRATNIGLQPSGTALTGHQNGASSYWAESTSIVNGSGWKHVAYTFDGSTVEIFIDGVSEDTQSAFVTNKTQALAYIGRWIGTTPFWLTGTMDDIRAYDRALTQAEITHLATARGVLGGPGSDGYNAFTSAIYKPRNYNNTRFG